MEKKHKKEKSKNFRPRSFSRRVIILSFFLLGAVASQPKIGMAQEIDAEGLMVCAIIYGETGTRLAQTQEEQNNLLGASGAYAAAALHIIGNTINDAEKAEEAANSLQERVLSSLQSQAENQISKQDEIISQWLPWCDAIGQQVTAIFSRLDTGLVF